MMVIGFPIALAATCLLYVFPRIGEVQQSANRMLQDGNVQKLIKNTRDELIYGNSGMSSLLINLNNPRVGDVYRGQSGKILLVDRLNLFGIWMEPKLKDG